MDFWTFQIHEDFRVFFASHVICWGKCWFKMLRQVVVQNVETRSFSKCDLETVSLQSSVLEIHWFRAKPDHWARPALPKLLSGSSAPNHQRHRRCRPTSRPNAKDPMALLVVYTTELGTELGGHDKVERKIKAMLNASMHLKNSAVKAWKNLAIAEHFTYHPSVSFHFHPPSPDSEEPTLLFEFFRQFFRQLTTLPIKYGTARQKNGSQCFLLLPIHNGMVSGSCRPRSQQAQWSCCNLSSVAISLFRNPLLTISPTNNLLTFLHHCPICIYLEGRQRALKRRKLQSVCFKFSHGNTNKGVGEIGARIEQVQLRETWDFACHAGIYIMMIQDRGGRFQYKPSTMVGAVRWYHGSVWCSTVVHLPEVTWYKTEARSEATRFWDSMLSSLDDLMFRSCLDVDITSLLQLPHTCKCWAVKLECNSFAAFALYPLQLPPKN